jgi:hypothetical protein
VYRVATVLCGLVDGVPRGTNLGLALLLWTLLTGRLLSARGAVIPALTTLGLSPRLVRRTWATLGQGAWSVERLLANRNARVQAESRWQPHT